MKPVKKTIKAEEPELGAYLLARYIDQKWGKETHVMAACLLIARSGRRV